MYDDLEIPLGKRTLKYRFFEILPGFLSYSLVILLIILSLIDPVLGAAYLMMITAITLVKAVIVAVQTVRGYNKMRRAMKVDWAKRLDDLSKPNKSLKEIDWQKNRGEFEIYKHKNNLKKMIDRNNFYPEIDSLYHAVIVTAYNEGMETLVPTLDAVLNTKFNNKQIILVLAYEERGGEKMAKQVEKLKKMYKNKFMKFLDVMHPDGLDQEIKGKGPNLSYAGEALEKFVEKEKLKSDNIIVTSLDSDNRMDPNYLSYVGYEFVVHEERQTLSYQPISMFLNNIWDVPAPMRVVGMSNSFFNLITSMRPHALRNFASHSQPFKALASMNFWSRRTIVEDGHQFWRSLFHFKGNYRVLTIRVPIYQDAVLEDSLLKTLKAQFIQLRRWDYGASDVAYVGVRLFNKKREMPFLPLLAKFLRLLDGHVTLAIMAPLITFGGWVPLVLNWSSRELIVHNLPKIMSTTQLIAMIGFAVTITLSLRILPKRPKEYGAFRSIAMLLQWLLVPVISLVYQSAAAFYSQTRLMTGLYMEKFDVTNKVTKKGKSK